MIKFNAVFLLVLFGLSKAVAQEEITRRWHLQKPGGDYFGVDAVTASCSSSQKVIVAVLDAGTDVMHPDLLSNIWVNPNEIIGNNIDDDQNGYVDDINGWNFLGGKNGNVDHETKEVTRLYRTPKAELPAGIKYKKVKKQYAKELKMAKANAAFFVSIRDSFNVMEQQIGTVSPTVEQLRSYPMNGKVNNNLKNSLIFAMQNGIEYQEFMKVIREAAKESENELRHHLNPDYNPRTVVEDHISDVKESSYGNSDVKGGVSEHGTHVAGIIGAVKGNDLGGDGITNNVELMIVRIVPDGDERDKDVANGVRYAVNNGARIINMSFGKEYSPDRAVVEEAIKYAASKDVLIVQGAGNDGQDNDTHDNFPTSYMLSTKSRATNYISVGSSNPDGTASDFSNYGALSVDVFAPGVNIYSTLPEREYGEQSGTSMASPVVAGLAGLLRSCYPKLSAAQVKDIIVKSAIKNDAMTPLPGNPKKQVPFSSLSVSGGIVNAEKALQAAAAIAH